MFDSIIYSRLTSVDVEAWWKMAIDSLYIMFYSVIRENVCSHHFIGRCLSLLQSSIGVYSWEKNLLNATEKRNKIHFFSFFRNFVIFPNISVTIFMVHLRHTPVSVPDFAKNRVNIALHLQKTKFNVTPAAIALLSIGSSYESICMFIDAS